MNRFRFPIKPNEVDTRELQKTIAEICNKAYKQGREEEQEFVEKRCKELGIDYTLIYTCDSAD